MLARGLGLIRVVTNLLHSYDAAGNNLIIVIGADERENGWIGEGEACSTLLRGMNIKIRQLWRSKLPSADPQWPKALARSTPTQWLWARGKVFISKSRSRPLISAREKMYSQGGIFSITSRILVVDLLSSITAYDDAKLLLIV